MPLIGKGIYVTYFEQECVWCDVIGQGEHSKHLHRLGCHGDTTL